MPIIDYEARAQADEDRLMKNPNIPDASKKILQRFLTAYDVSSARRQIFLTKIKLFLESFPDVEVALTDRDQINAFFAKLRRRYSPASYATYMGVIRRFLVWLNHGDAPKSMCDLRYKSQGKTKRDLHPEDMWTWQDGLKVERLASSVQLSAICMTQLDCGFRPSEFVDLNYGDVEVQTGLALIHIRNGKTGSRTVIAHRCVPYLLKWLDAHPGKQPTDPLWIKEDCINGSADTRVRLSRYNYPAMSKRLRETAAKAGINKPTDFYCLRHSSCVLDKIENLPVDLAAERHGHSVKHFVGTYGRLSVQDVVRRFQSHYGQQVDDPKEAIKHRSCPNCHAINAKDASWCIQCGTPFHASGAVLLYNLKR